MVHSDLMFLLVIAITIAFFMVIGLVKQKILAKKTGKVPKGYALWLIATLGMVFGYIASLPIGRYFESTNLSSVVGPAAGLIISLIIGLSVEWQLKKRNKIRELTEEERKKKAAVFITGIIFLIILATALIYNYFI